MTPSGLQKIIEQSIDLICTVNEAGLFTWLNPACISMLGYHPDELANKPFTEYVVEADKEKTIAQSAQIFSGISTTSFENRWIHRDGRLIPIIWSAKWDNDEKLMYCIGKDLTEKVKNEQDLRLSKERYDFVTKATTDAIWDLDLVNHTIYWGEGYYYLFGYKTTHTNADLKTWEQAIHPLDVQRVIAEMDAILASTGNRYQSEYRFKKANGAYAYVLDRGFVIRNEQGKAIRVVGAMQDYTAQKNEEERKLIFNKVSTLFNQSLSMQDTLQQVLEMIAAWGNYHFAETWLIDADQQALNLIACIKPNKLMHTFYNELADFKVLTIGEGLAGKTWELQKLVHWKAQEFDEYFLRSKEVSKTGIKSIYSLPLYNNNLEIIGVQLLGSSEDYELRLVSSDFFEEFGKHLGAEIKRKQLESELHQIFNYSEDIIAISNLQGFFKKINPAAVSILGFSEAELLSQPFGSFLEPDDLERSIEALVNLAKSPQKIYFENRLITKSREVKWIGWTTSSAPSDGLIFSIGKDITQQKNLQALLDRATDLARIGGWELDVQHNTLHWSPLTRAMYEVPDDFIPDFENALDFYWNDADRNTVIEIFQNLGANGQKADMEVLLKTYQGNKRWVRVIAEPEYYNNKLVKIIGSLQDIHQLKETELSLSEMNKKLFSTLDSIQDGFYALDKNWHITYWNAEAERLLLRKKDEVLGKNLWDEFSEAASLKFYPEYHRAMDEKIPVRFEEFFPPLHSWYDISAYPSENGITVYFKDITERKQIEMSLRHALEEKNTILESINDAFISFDKNWIVTYWNKQAESLLGTKREEVIDRNIWDVYSDAVGTDFYHNYYSAMATGKATAFEAFYTGVNKWLDVTAYPSSKGLSVYFRDVTRRKYNEEQVKLSNERFIKVAEATNDAIWDWNIVEDITYRGDGYNKLFGYDLEEISHVQDFWVNLIHREDRHMVLDSLEAVLTDENASNWQAEYRFQKANKTYAYVIDRGIVMRNSHGKAIKMVGAITDITDRKKSEEYLQRLNEDLNKRAKELAISNAELEQYAFVASHDLQEPLRMVTSFLAQLEKKYSDKLDEKAILYISLATDGAKRMRQIILDLLEFSRVGKQRHQLEFVDLNKVVEEVISLQQAVVQEKKAIIIAKDLPILRSYRIPLSQVFQNLIGNALKYSKPNEAPRIEITAAVENDKWQIAVSDNGIGMSEEYFEKIFIIFQRLHSKNEYEGTGMGLSIVKKIIDHLEGRIWLTSQVGVGTTFYFTLPMHD